MKDKIKKKFLIFLPLTACVILLIVCGMLVKHIIIVKNELKAQQGKRIEVDSIREKVKQISQHSAYEVNYTSILCFSERSQFLGMNIPLTGNSFIAAIDGTMHIGIDGEKVEAPVERKDSSGKIIEVNIRIPHSKILDNDPIPETLEIYDEKNNIFNPVKAEEYNNLLVEAKEKERKKVLNSDILQKSDEAIQYWLSSYFHAVYGEDVNINFEYIQYE